MVLPSELISEFVKVTNDTVPTQPSTTMAGTIKVIDGTQYVQLNGSELLTPIVTTTDVIDGDQVTVEIKNHTATVTGNMSSPAARTGDVQEIGGKISEFEIVIADKVSTKQLEAQVARIDTLVSDNVTINKTLTANTANINKLIAKDVEIDGLLSAKQAEIDNLKANKIDASIVEATYATIQDLQATEISVETLMADIATVFELQTEHLEAHDASIENLEANKLSAKDADLKYANIDFANIGEAAIGKIYANIGVIEGITTKDVSVTGKLVAVNIHGDVIEGNTIKADKLIVLGDDGLYYRLNVNSLGETTASSDAKYKNGLDGSVIIAESITANKIDVTDLVAFGATIGGFKITENSIYSGSKSTVGNTTRGLFLDNSGQVAFGDSNNFLKYYYDNTSQSYKLAVSADTVTFGVGNKKNVETELNNIQTEVDNIEIGGRNIITNSKNMRSYTSGSDTGATRYYTTEGDVTFITFDMSTRSDGRDYDNAYVWLTFSIEKKQGEEYTISFDYRSQTDAKLYFYPNQNDQKFTTWSLPNSGGEWVRFSRTYTHTGTTTAETSLFGCHHLTDNTLPIDIRLPKLEKGNKATDWTPAPEDIDADINTAQNTANTAKTDAGNAQNTANTARTEAANAAKTATNYIAGTDAGLIVGNMTAGTLGSNVLIDTDSVDIRNGDTVYASYGASEIFLGKHSENTVIDLCNGSATMKNVIDENYDQPIFQLHSNHAITLDGTWQVNSSTFYNEDFSWGGTIFRCASHEPNLLPVSREDISVLPDAFCGTIQASAYRKYLTSVNGDIAGDWCEMTIGGGEIHLGAYDGAVITSPASSEWNASLSLNHNGRITMKAERLTITGDMTLNDTLTVAKTLTANGAIAANSTLTVTKAITANDVLTVAKALNANGALYANNNIYLPNGKVLYGINASGATRQLAYINATNQIRFGYGGYANNEGETHLLGGDAIRFYVKYADATFKPYYDGGDNVSLEWYGAGFISSSKQKVYFSIPLSKPIIGNPTISVTSLGGITVRQENAYLYGSDSDTYAKPSSYTASISAHGTFVKIIATMPNTTNVAYNNDACGVHAYIKLTFAYG